MNMISWQTLKIGITKMCVKNLATIFMVTVLITSQNQQAGIKKLSQEICSEIEIKNIELFEKILLIVKQINQLEYQKDSQKNLLSGPEKAEINKKITDLKDKIAQLINSTDKKTQESLKQILNKLNFPQRSLIIEVVLKNL